MPSLPPDPQPAGTHVDVSTLSAYYDGALDRATRQDVDTHLAVCSACRERLASYVALGNAIQAIADGPLPATLDARLAGLLRRAAAAGSVPTAEHSLGDPEQPADKPAGVPLVRYIWAPFALVVLLAAAFLAVRFLPGTTARPLATATPVATAPILAPAAAAPASSPTSGPTAAPTLPVVALAPASTSTATIAASPAAATPGASCAITPVRGFGTLYQSQPAVAARLGCPLAAESAVDLASQTFQNGRLLWRGDQNQIVVLFTANHIWTTFPGASGGTPTPVPAPGTTVNHFGVILANAPSDLTQRLGPATSPETQQRGAVQDYQHGSLLWTPDYTIFAIYSVPTSSWDQYADTFRDATPAAATSTPAANLTPSPLPAAQATPSPADGCPNPPIRGFGMIYQQNLTVANRLGCPVGTETGIQISLQPFDSGQLLWPGNTGDIIVLKRDGTWSGYPNTWQAGQPLPDPGTPPSGHLAPVGSFGKVWGQQPGVRSSLGWATAAAQPVQGAEQSFAKGRMLWTADRSIYVLYPDGTWQSFADTFPG